MTFTPGLVTTIIPVYNRERMLVTAVESVLAQTHRPIEIIITDDGSTDETPNVARSLALRYPNIIHCEFQSNAGPGPARELGRSKARGEFLQYLDSDDRLHSNKFADQVAALSSHPECDIAYGITRLVDETGKVLADPFKWTGRTIDGLFPGLLVDRWWCTHTPLYRRSLTDRIGPWTNMRWSQDWEYDARAGALGARLVHCGTVVSDHIHHSGVRQTSGADWAHDPVRLKNRYELLIALWTNAKVAGISLDAPECQHCARWCFRIARQCGAAGLHQQSVSLIDIAFDAAQNGPGRRGLGIYQSMVLILGSSLMGRLSMGLEALRPGATSESTMPQSFSNQTALK